MLNFDWLASVSMPAARAVFLVLFVVIGLVIQLIPGHRVYEGVERPRWFHDVRLWAWLVLGVIFVTYSVF